MQASGGLSAIRSDPARVAQCVLACGHRLSGHAVQWPVVFRRRVLGPSMRVCLCITVTGSPCLSPCSVRLRSLYGEARMCVLARPLCLCRILGVPELWAERLGH